MNVAVTEWQGRVSPVFDVAGTVILFDGEGARKRIELPGDCPWSKLCFLRDLQVEVLICGAISRSVDAMANELGMRVNPFVSGDVDAVWAAWKSGTLSEACYSMPGCRRCRRRQGRCGGANQ